MKLLPRISGFISTDDLPVSVRKHLSLRQQIYFQTPTDFFHTLVFRMQQKSKHGQTKPNYETKNNFCILMAYKIPCKDFIMHYFI